MPDHLKPSGHTHPSFAAIPTTTPPKPSNKSKATALKIIAPSKKTRATLLADINARNQIILKNQAPAPLKVVTGPVSLSVCPSVPGQLIPFVSRQIVDSYHGDPSLDQLNLSLSPKTLNKRRQGFLPTTSFAGPEYYDTGRYFKLPNRLASTSLSAFQAKVGALALNLFHGVSHAASQLSLKTSVAIQSSTNPPGTKQAATNIDIRSLFHQFNLDPEVTIYACCPLPKCSAIYPSTINPADGIPYYPIQCTQSKFGSVCGTPLTSGYQSRMGQSVPKPVKPYAYHHFHDHVAALLSRPGIENAISEYAFARTLKGKVADIMQSPVIESFQDPNGAPYIRPTGSEIRLVWALCGDWYNPFKNKAAGKAASSGVIALICLSLPPDIRTREENIYIAGVIPGPQEPSLDAVNHFLDPLMNDLNAAYETGTYYSRTYQYPKGRLGRSAVIPVIADTLASKKLTGNCAHNSKFFCSRCRLEHSQVANFDPSTWPSPLTREVHEVYAKEWLDAPSANSQKNVLKKNGVRWSALLMLRYWQPSQWTITEPVHVLLLGLIPRHCRDLLGLNFNDLPDSGLDAVGPSKKALALGKKAMRDPTRAKLKALTIPVLQALCRKHSVVLPPLESGCISKMDYISALMAAPINEDKEGNPAPSSKVETTTSNKDDALPGIDPINMTHTSPHVITKQHLEAIRRDIAETVRPDFQGGLLKNFGTASHGKLKADQWRTALEFDLPISLVKILSERQPSGNIEEDQRFQRVLEHTLDLAIALSWGLSRQTSPHHAERFGFYIRRYLTAIEQLYPTYSLKPNHHYALHTPDLLQAFGPLHGIWAYALERLIGRLQNFSSNSKIGELESSALFTFCHRANLIQFVQSDHCPATIKAFWEESMSKLASDDLNLPGLGQQRRPVQTTRTPPQSLDDDISDALSRTLTLDAHPISLNPKKATQLNSFVVDKTSYGPSSKSQSRSLMYYRDERNDGGKELIPCRIRQIFESAYITADGKHTNQEVFFAVHRYEPDTSKQHIFAPFRDFQAEIYLSAVSEKVLIIRPSQVCCPANQRPWDEWTVVMKPIDREGPSDRVPNPSVRM